MIPIKDIIPTRTRPGVTIVLVALNAAIFVLQATLPPPDAEAFIFSYGLIPADFTVPTLFTSMFVHAGLGHVAGNLLYLWIFGDNVEDRLGHGRFLAFYLATGVVAALSQAAMDPASELPMVGASGAIAGVMGGYLVLYPRSRVLTLLPFPLMVFEVPAVFFLGLWFAIEFISGLGSLAAGPEEAMMGGVAFWAHVMGFVAGVALVRLLRRPERDRVEWWSP